VALPPVVVLADVVVVVLADVVVVAVAVLEVVAPAEPPPVAGVGTR
jgi:hypothetical protein